MDTTAADALWKELEELDAERLALEHREELRDLVSREQGSQGEIPHNAVDESTFYLGWVLPINSREAGPGAAPGLAALSKGEIG